MTSINIDLRNPDGSAPAKMTIVFTPTRVLSDGTHEYLDAPKRVTLTNGEGGVDLLATDTPAYGDAPWAWRCTEYRPNADGRTTFRLVPTSLTVLEYAGLVIVSPDGFEEQPDPDPLWWHRIEVLEAALEDGSLAGPPGPDGPAGLSAYQLAVINGFVGTEPQWLASLVGPPGADGDPGGGGARIHVGPSAPEDPEDGDIWLVFVQEQLGAGLRASPGAVGYLGLTEDLTTITPGQSLVGTVFEGTFTGWTGPALEVRGDDLVIENYFFDGVTVIFASGANPIMRNCVVHAPANSTYGVNNAVQATTFTIEDTTIVCDSTGTLAVAALFGDGRLIARRVDVSGSADGIHFPGIVGSSFTDGSVISQCCIHDLAYLDSEQHLDGLQVYNTIASNTTTDTWVLIEHNYVQDVYGPLGESMNAGLTIGKPTGDDTGPYITAKIDNNLFLGGGFHMFYSYRTQHGVITNNNFGALHPGEFGFVTVANSGSVDTWTNNRDGSGPAGTGGVINNPNP
jgi:hypothetical protein